MAASPSATVATGVAALPWTVSEAPQPTRGVQDAKAEAQTAARTRVFLITLLLYRRMGPG